jgi:hypothetical protein
MVHNILTRASVCLQCMHTDINCTFQQNGFVDQQDHGIYTC